MPARILHRRNSRHKLPFDRDDQQQPFCWHPPSGYLAAPWPRGRASPDDERRLAAVMDRIGRIDACELTWVWPDEDREPIPVKPASERHFFAWWSRDRAIYDGVRARGYQSGVTVPSQDYTGEFAPMRDPYPRLARLGKLY